ncbi:MAG TPA: DedA family protein [bacterium]|nr:DedA family protein [bacterium]
MDFLHQAVDFFLHLDKHLNEIFQNYGLWTYGIIFAIIFCETGLVITPFLPGDSLLFAVGALSAKGSLNVVFAYLLMTGAALLGDNTNYWIGRFLGENAFGKLVNRKHLTRTHAFYEKHGVLTLVIAQFVPIVRTFAPFVAGVGEMTYSGFVTFNLIGVLSWSTLFLWSGYFFGNLDFVQQNFHYVVLGIILVSITPILFEIGKMVFAEDPGAPKAPAKKKK